MRIQVPLSDAPAQVTMEPPERAGTQVGYRPAPGPQIVSHLGRYGVFHREQHKHKRPRRRQLLLPAEQPVEVQGGAGNTQEQVCKIRHQAEPEKL